jgi:putative ABC transport system ATP-binding protein
VFRLEGIRKTFNRGEPNEKLALNGVNLVLDEGEFAVVIGSNGAGKSTLLNVVAGDVAPEEGRVVVGDEDITRLPAHQRSRFIARVFQDTNACTAPGLSIEENMAIAAARARRPRLASPINRDSRQRFNAALAPLGLGLENRLTDRVDLLSGGQRQAVSLVMALLGDPKLLILDEHCAALDPRTAETVMRATVEAVERTRITTLMVTHNMHHAIAYGTRLVMLHEGRVLFEARGEEKARLTVDMLVKRFGIVDDELLLAT